jgi:CRP-like cAMP-binding protein
MEKARKINTEALLHSKLFYNYREDLFESHYFNCFKATKMRKSEYLFKQNEERKYIYFIKKGDVQIELLSTWKDLDIIIDSLGNRYITYHRSFKKLISSNEKLQVFSQKKQKFNISIYSSGEIVGFEEHILQDTNKFMFSAICLSECEIFTLEIEFIEKIIGEKILRDNYNKLISEKREKLYQRLNALKSNIFYQYNNLIEEKIDSNNSQSQSKEKAPQNLFKNKNKLKIYKKLIYLTPEIKNELNNLSIEKKNININKERKLLKLGIQTRKPKKSLLFSSILKKQEKCYLLTDKNNMRTTILDNDNHHSLREPKIKYSNTNNSLIALNHPISKLNIKSQKKNLKDNQKPIKSKTLTKISKIKFSLKGKVPNLLFNHANAISTLIDNLISKEKDLYNSSNENRKTINGVKNNKDEFSKKINHNSKFISHVELLGLDKFIDNIAVNKRKKSLENQNDGSKSNGKLKLLPLTITTNYKYNFYT